MILFPKEIPEAEILYWINPGQTGNFHQPEIPPEVEFSEIRLNGKVASQELSELLEREYGVQWEREILRGLK